MGFDSDNNEGDIKMIVTCLAKVKGYFCKREYNTRQIYINS